MIEHKIIRRAYAYPDIEFLFPLIFEKGIDSSKNIKPGIHVLIPDIVPIYSHTFGLNIGFNKSLICRVTG